MTPQCERRYIKLLIWFLCRSQLQKLNNNRQQPRVDGDKLQRTKMNFFYVRFTILLRPTDDIAMEDVSHCHRRCSTWCSVVNVLRNYEMEEKRMTTMRNERDSLVARLPLLGVVAILRRISIYALFDVDGSSLRRLRMKCGRQKFA